MEHIILIAIVAVLASILPYFGRKYGSKRRRLHRKNVKKARKLIEMFRKWDPPGLEARILTYLRKIDPLVFEELVLSCLQDAGAKIRRNRRYTGDGGIDGVFQFNGDRWLMQAKRYSSSINPQHVRDFACQCNGNHGVFVHTGRTGKKSYLHAKPNVEIISGERLIHLILRNSFKEGQGGRLIEKAQ